MFQRFKHNLKKLIVIGTFLAVFLPSSQVLAVDNNSAVQAATNATQTASTGEATSTNNGEVPSETFVTPPTAPTPVTAPTTPTYQSCLVAPTAPTIPIAPTAPTAPGNAGPSVPDATVTNTTNAAINNCVNSGANTGDANVVGNGTAGDATTGNADVMATLINLIQSSGLSGAALTTFIANIENMDGNLHIDPAALANFAANNPGCGCAGTVQTILNAQINNNVNLDAGSGNANVSGNGTAGNAATGDANAVANVVNMINSMAAAGQSFLGIINIFGTLNGNILLPPGWYDNLLASGALDGGSGCNGCGPGGSNMNVNINNNLNLNASSGNADVSNNGSAGNALTGDALTNINIINMVNRQIVGGNVLLVFINVLGHWVGVLMDAPVGTTTGTLGGGITDNSSCACASGLSALNADINNNINLNAHSGNAAVTYNGKAGNATTGNATASLNLLNIVNSQLSLAHWFGVLFINVFGTWNGSLLEDKPPVTSVDSTKAPVSPPQLLRISTHKVPSVATTTTTSLPEQKTPKKLAGNVLGASTFTPADPIENNGGKQNYWLFMLLSGSCYCAIGVGARLRRMFS